MAPVYALREGKQTAGDMKKLEIKEWVAGKMPDVVEDLKRICRVKSVAEVKETACPPYGQGCMDVLKEMLLLIDQE